MKNPNYRSRYKILHDFQVQHLHILQLDGDYEFGNYDNSKAVIDNRPYKYTLNSVKSWAVLENAGDIPEDYFKGKTVEFVRSTKEFAKDIMRVENLEAISA